MRRWTDWLPVMTNALEGPFEVIGFTLIAAGIDESYRPAALIFAGAALVFIAQGMGRDG